MILVGAALAGVLTTWAPVMAQSPGWTYKVNANFGWGRSSFDTDIQTSLGTASSGGANATQWSFGGDGRVQIPMFGTWSGVVGVAGDRELSGNSTTFFDLGPGLGTTVSWRREGFVLPYGGISGRFPTVSSRMAGQLGSRAGAHSTPLSMSARALNPSVARSRPMRSACRISPSPWLGSPLAWTSIIRFISPATEATAWVRSGRAGVRVLRLIRSQISMSTRSWDRSRPLA